MENIFTFKIWIAFYFELYFSCLEYNSNLKLEFALPLELICIKFFEHGTQIIITLDFFDMDLTQIKRV